MIPKAKKSYTPEKTLVFNVFVFKKILAWLTTTF